MKIKSLKDAHYCEYEFNHNVAGDETFFATTQENRNALEAFCYRMIALRSASITGCKASRYKKSYTWDREFTFPDESKLIVRENKYTNLTWVVVK